MDRALGRFFASKEIGQWTHIISKSTQKYLMCSKRVLDLQKWDLYEITKCNFGGLYSEKLLSSSQSSEGTDILEKKAEPHLRLVVKSRVELPQTDMTKMNGHSTAIPVEANCAAVYCLRRVVKLWTKLRAALIPCGEDRPSLVRIWLEGN